MDNISIYLYRTGFFLSATFSYDWIRESTAGWFLVVPPQAHLREKTLVIVLVRF